MDILEKKKRQTLLSYTCQEDMFYMYEHLI